MKIKRLKEILANLDDDLEIFVRNSVNPLGNIQELDQIEASCYGSFGQIIPCLILNTDSSKKLESDKNDDVIDFIDKNSAEF